MLCIQEAFGSDLGKDIRYPDYCFFAVLCTPTRDNTSVRPQPLPVHYSPIILPFNAV